MEFRVRIMPRAERDLARIYREVGGSSAGQAWYQGLKGGLRSLQSDPLRCPTVPEDVSYRHWLYGRKPHVYRTIYRVMAKAKRVEILHIRHGARDLVEDSDLRI